MNENQSSDSLNYDPYQLDLKALALLAGIGAAAGVIGWLLTLAITQFFIDPVFCQSPDNFSVCRNGGTIAWISAHVVTFAALVAVFARFAVYRPLLVVLGLIVALWSANVWLGAMVWYSAALWQAVLFGVGAALFGWIARIPKFFIAAIVTLLFAIMARVVLMLS